MSFFGNLFGLGRKDKQGKQVRIEHRGKFTRLSRTGGAALRAVKKLLGVNATVNTSTGIRLSKKISKGTRVALQNGNFRLIGRWKSGPWGFNLSKTGASASYKNKMGTFNFLKPQYSSFKFAGIQLRGRNAAGLQGLYIIFNVGWSLVVLLVKLMIYFLWLVSLPALFLIDLIVGFFSELTRRHV